MSNGRKSDAGATLLEVLLALAVMGMIGLAMNSLFRTGGQVWQRIDNNSELPQQAVARFELRVELENMPIVSASVPMADLFEIRASGFAFTPNPPTNGDDPSWIYLELTKDQLLVGREDEPQTMLLRDKLARGQVTYYGRKSVREGAAWHDNWHDATILPLLIKIETWAADGTINPPLSIQPGKTARQSEISLSSLVPPD